MVAGLFVFVACDNSNNGKAEIVGVQDGKIEGDAISIDAGITVDSIDLSSVISVSKGATFGVYEDEEAMLAVPDKKIKLKRGDNEFFVIVKNGGISKTYTLNVWKHFYATVDYYVDGVKFGSESVLSHTYLDDYSTPVNLVGIQFLGWDCEGRYVDETYIRIDAKIKRNKYSVTLNSDGGTNDGQKVEVEYGLNFKFPVPEKEGHTFLGWNLALDNGTFIIVTHDTGESVDTWLLDEDVEVNAEWRINAYYVYFKTDGSGAGTIGSYGSDEKSFYGDFGETDTITARTESPYYVFDGWYDGDTLVCAEEQLTFTVDTRETTYIAKWRKIPETEIFEIEKDYSGYVLVGINDRNITSLTIPDKISSIKKGALFGLGKLEEISLPFILSSSLQSDETNLFGYLFGEDRYSGSIAVTQTKYEYIYSKDKKETKVYQIPESLHKVTVRGGDIGPHAFSGFSGLDTVILGDEVASIGDYAFMGCNQLADITFSNKIDYVGMYALQDTPWYGAQPSGMIYINKVAYKYKREDLDVESVVLRNDATVISERAFEELMIGEVIIPLSVQTVYADLFYNCHIIAVGCEAERRPEGWSMDWNRKSNVSEADEITVVWGYSESSVFPNEGPAE